MSAPDIRISDRTDAADGVPRVMDRRTFVGAAGGGFLAAALAVRAQQAQKVYRIGWLSAGPMPLGLSFWEAMRALGWVDGQNLRVERRVLTKRDELPEFAAELVRLNVDLIMTYGSPASSAARDATSTIPVVFFVGADPVQNRLVTSLARPGRNLTGVVDGIYDEKRLQILKEAVPGISRVAYPSLGDPDEGIMRAAKVLAIQALDIVLPNPLDFGPFFADAKKAGADAVLVADIAALVPQLERMGVEALKHRLPAIGFRRNFVESGGLLYYGSTPAYEGPLLAALVDKILKGAKPAELAVQQPTRFEFVISLKTAKALGLTIPAPLIARADDVIR